MIENLLRFVPIVSRDDVTVQQADSQEFLNAILSGNPFRKEYQIDKVVIGFVSPPFDIFNKELTIDDLFVGCLDFIVVGSQKILPPQSQRPLEERMKTIKTVLFQQPSPLAYVVVQKFVEFFYLFQKLLYGVLDPHFFVTGSTGSSSN